MKIVQRIDLNGDLLEQTFVTLSEVINSDEKKNYREDYVPLTVKRNLLTTIRLLKVWLPSLDVPSLIVRESLYYQKRLPREISDLIESHFFSLEESQTELLTDLVENFVEKLERSGKIISDLFLSQMKEMSTLSAALELKRDEKYFFFPELLEEKNEELKKNFLQIYNESVQTKALYFQNLSFPLLNLSLPLVFKGEDNLLLSGKIERKNKALSIAKKSFLNEKLVIQNLLSILFSLKKKKSLLIKKNLLTIGKYLDLKELKKLLGIEGFLVEEWELFVRELEEKKNIVEAIEREKNRKERRRIREEQISVKIKLKQDLTEEEKVFYHCYKNLREKVVQTKVVSEINSGKENVQAENIHSTTAEKLETNVEPVISRGVASFSTERVDESLFIKLLFFFSILVFSFWASNSSAKQRISELEKDLTALLSQLVSKNEEVLINQKTKRN